MRLKKYMFLFAAVLSVSMLFACSPKEAKQKLDSIENSVEQKLDRAEDKIEGVVTPNGNIPATNTAQITSDEAQLIALAHAGFTAEQVTGLYAEYEVDDGIAQYDVKFRRDRIEYDYEINAETGEIISFDMDD